MSSLPLRKFTVDEYLAMDRAADVKSEFHDGELFPISAVSFRHSKIAANATRRMGEKLDGTGCSLLISPLRVRVGPTKYVYPDIMIVCGDAEFTDEIQDTITNPKVIVEILSPSTADYDYGAKFRLYRNLASFSEYVLIAQDQPSVEVFRRVDETDWLLSTYSGLDAEAPVKCLDFRIPLSELYAGC